ncbi:TetR family transcriptional regulator [Deinococcus aquiradiocola]|uniref:TetR family transcriptional regulator n=1 Tax=Deinococcus aquiradiocola TaxID=393059 RepID=A0A917UQU6_9DEIO|nr:TetR family transcriptional regulator [Deinococcus aquiradiocola]GGJ77746.1 TetR family transcriptional regulator [Deinococcus aquiradiocola]
MTSTAINDEFRRARTEEQRQQRRGHILGTTREMLQGRRLAELSFNEIARGVGLAKSNIMRYFESREAILLTLLQEDYAAWVDEVETELAQSMQPDPIERVAEVLSRTIMARSLLCELLTATPTVLEHNVTTEEIIPFKLGIQASMGRLMTLLSPALGTWTPEQKGVFLGELHATVTHTWALAHPASALEAAYAARPDIAVMPNPAQVVVREAIATVLTGLKYRRPLGRPSFMDEPDEGPVSG